MFFLDPHGDAIEDLLKRYTFAKEVNILDPTDETHSFGINLLACKNVHSITERQDTYSRARTVFKKLFEGDANYRPWLELIIQNTLHAFIENQAYTLAEIPLFLNVQNAAFRNHIVGNIRHNRNAAYFWQQEFARHRREQQERVDAALTRFSTLMSDQYVAHIVSQRTSTIDFAEIMAEGRVLLIKLPRRLAPDTSKFIGTILLSELVHAVMRRPELKRNQFCIFVDEMQNFVSSEDFATLITEGRKFGVAFTGAHQERFGQLTDNKKVAGATLATVNKALFQLSVRDADELAPEYARDPPTETRYERVLVPSSRPFEDLLIGHSNPRIRRFVDAYLRPIKERIEDVQREMDAERLERMALLDEAAVASLEERLIRFQVPAGVNTPLRQNALIRAQASQTVAAEKIEHIRSLQQWATQGAFSIRFLNKLFTAVMYGALVPRPGNEAFSAFLIRFVRSATALPVAFDRFNPMDLYIQLTYGEAEVPREVPLEFAEKYGLFEQETSEIRDYIATVKQRWWDEIWQYNWEQGYNCFASDKAVREASRKQHHDRVVAELTAWYCNGPYRGSSSSYATQDWRISDFIKVYIYFSEFPEVQQLFAPFLTDRIADQDHPRDWFAWEKREWENLRDATLRIMKEAKREKKDLAWRYRGVPNSYRHAVEISFTKPYFQPFSFQAFQSFVETHKEGTLTVLYLLKMFEYIRSGNGLPTAVPTTSRSTGLTQPEEDRYERYRGVHMLRFIKLEHHDALFVLKTYLALNKILAQCQLPSRCRRYYWVGADVDPYSLFGIREESQYLISDGMPMPQPPVWQGKPMWEGILGASEKRPDFLEPV